MCVCVVPDEYQTNISCVQHDPVSSDLDVHLTWTRAPSSSVLQRVLYYGVHIWSQRHEFVSPNTINNSLWVKLAPGESYVIQVSHVRAGGGISGSKGFCEWEHQWQSGVL